MKYTPREYQGDITDFELEHKKCAIWSFMGSGKTVATLTAIDAAQLAGIDTRPTLVLAPKRVAQSTWPDEVLKWDHLQHMEVSAIVGTEAERLIALRNPHAAVFTTNYENVQWMIETLGDKWPFQRVIADEATKLKGLKIDERVSSTGKRFLRSGGGSKRAGALAKLAHKATAWVNLTGTPAPNGLLDLWGQTWFLDRGERLGRSFEAYKQRYFRSIPCGSFSKIEPLEFAQEQISTRIKDICLSLKGEDYFALDEPIKNKAMVRLPDKAMSLYQDMEKEMYLEIETIGVEAFNAAAKTAKCHQLANGAIYLDPDVTCDDAPKVKPWKEAHDVKLQALESIANEWVGRPIIVAYHFKSDLARLQKAFPKGRVLDHNPKTIKDWNAGKIPMLFAHPASAGHGLNLQDGGHIIVFFSLNWNYEEHAQILERIGPVRQMQAGHKRLVYVYFLLAQGTIDEDIMGRLEGKFTTEDALRNAVRRVKNKLMKGK